MDRLEPCGLYIHIPFCLRKCSYCDFVSYRISSYDTARYCSAVVREMQLVLGSSRRISVADDGLLSQASIEGLRPTTVYIGGGTPTVLPVEQLGALITSIWRVVVPHQDYSECDIEFTVEANPETLSEEYLSELRRLGVNRLSIGLQSTMDKYLSMLGRPHSFDEFVKSYRLAVQSGFHNISVDLIYGLPGQTLEEWREDLSRVVELTPSHISCYALTLSDGTALSEEVRSFRLPEPQEDLVADMYHDTVSVLTESGYCHYEISNFAAPGMECKHNMNYWLNGYYVGLGVAAHAHLRGVRYANTAEVERYINRVEAGVFMPEHVEAVSPARELSDSFILGLRTARGVNLKELAERFGEAPVAELAGRLERFVDIGLVESSEGQIRLTEQGMILSNEIMAEVL